MSNSTHPAAHTTPKRPRGFAAMHPDHVKAIAQKGGKAAHAQGTAHEFTPEEARLAGRKGGKSTHAKRRNLTTAAVSGMMAGAANPTPAPQGNIDNPCRSTGDKGGCGGKSGCNSFERPDGTPCTEEEANKDAGSSNVDESGPVGGDLADSPMGSDKASCGGRAGCGAKS